MQQLLALVVLTGSFLNAQVKPDFSGVFLEQGTRYGGDISAPAIPRSILDIQQGSDEIIVKAVRNGETGVAHFPFHSKKPNPTRARWKGKVLVLEADGAAPGGQPDLVFIQKWQLSANGQELVIHDNRVSGTIRSYSESYDRQLNLEAAEKIAAMKSGEICNQSLQQWFSRSAQRESELRDGIELGIGSFQQVTRCVLYDAVLSGGFFKKLERNHSAPKPEFRKIGQIVATYTGNLTLEVGPRPGACSSRLERFVSQGSPHPEPVKNLRFMVRWMGTAEKDLGEVEAKFLHEPWREQWPSEVFYRMEIPAEGIPLTDDLEILIFSETGEPLACVKGHL